MRKDLNIRNTCTCTLYTQILQDASFVHKTKRFGCWFFSDNNKETIEMNKINNSFNGRQRVEIEGMRCHCGILRGTMLT